MALLNRASWIAAAWLCALASGSCDSSAPPGHVEVWLRDCHGASDACDDDTSGSASDVEYIVAEAFIDPAASRYAPNGFYAYFELPRADGSIGLFELDVPTDAAEDAALPHYEASYRELSGERVRFASRALRGQLVVPDSHADGAAADCACTDSAFALTFIDAGDDGVTGTADDAMRRLSLGRMGWSERFCRPQQDLAIGTDLRVTRAACDAPEQTAPREQPATRAASDGQGVGVAIVGEPAPRPVSTADGCSSDSDYDAYEDTRGDGCASSSDSDTGASDGCASNSDRSAPSSDPTPTSSTDSSESGCEGDSSSSSDGACTGDSSDADRSDASSCSIARAPLHPVRRRRSSPFIGTGVPLLLACWVQVARARAQR